MAIPDRLKPLLDETSELAGRLADRGHRLYLVGGAVRDAVLGRDLENADLDFTTDARPDEIEAAIAGWAESVWTIGREFGTIGCERGGRRFEITTHRGDRYAPDSRHPEVVFTDAVEVDLSRRDFTVNAMALDLATLQLVDPFDGLADLAAHLLRTPIDPRESFSDDPLRMLRAARFVAGFGLAPEAGLIDAVGELKGRLSIVSRERIRDELDKLLIVDIPSPGLWFIVQTGLADEFLPELPALALEQDPVHRHKDVLAHTIAVVDKTGNDKILRLAALLHDIGKPKTRAIGPQGVSFHHHEVVGARMARERMTDLRYPGDEIDDVTKLVQLHLRFHTYKMGWSDAAIRRYVRDAGPLLDRLNELTRCDCTTRSKARAAELNSRMDDLVKQIDRLRAQEELDSIRPDLDGRQVMEILGVSPGPAVGQALTFLLDLRLEEGPLGEEEAARRLRDWFATLGAESGR